jgi:hypothetical protein
MVAGSAEAMHAFLQAMQGVKASSRWQHTVLCSMVDVIDHCLWHRCWPNLWAPQVHFIAVITLELFPVGPTSCSPQVHFIAVITLELFPVLTSFQRMHVQAPGPGNTESVTISHTPPARWLSRSRS